MRRMKDNPTTGIILVTTLQFAVWTANIVGFNHYSDLDALAFSLLLSVPFLALSVINAILVIRHIIQVGKHQQKLDTAAVVLVMLLLLLVLMSPLLIG